MLLRRLALCSLLPELPTLAEAGLAGVEAFAVYALMAPRGMPKEIVALLNRETRALLLEPALKDKLGSQGIVLGGSTPEACRAFIVEAVARWAKVMKDAGIKPE